MCGKVQEGSFELFPRVASLSGLCSVANTRFYIAYSELFRHLKQDFMWKEKYLKNFFFINAVLRKKSTKKNCLRELNYMIHIHVVYILQKLQVMNPTCWCVDVNNIVSFRAFNMSTYYQVCMRVHVNMKVPPA